MASGVMAGGLFKGGRRVITSHIQWGMDVGMQFDLYGNTLVKNAISTGSQQITIGFYARFSPQLNRSQDSTGKASV